MKRPDGLRALSESLAELIATWEITHNTTFCQAWRSDGGVYYIRYRIRDRKAWRRARSSADDPLVAKFLTSMLEAADACSRVLYEVAQADNTHRILVYTVDARRDPPRMEYVALESTYNIAAV